MKLSRQTRDSTPSGARYRYPHSSSRTGVDSAPLAAASSSSPGSQPDRRASTCLRNAIPRSAEGSADGPDFNMPASSHATARRLATWRISLPKSRGSDFLRVEARFGRAESPIVLCPSPVEPGDREAENAGRGGAGGGGTCAPRAVSPARDVPSLALPEPPLIDLDDPT